MQMREPIGPIVMLSVLVTVLVGCGKPESIAGDTPKATADAFVEAMHDADYEAIAAGWDYETYARTENPDWDTFGESQRKLIIGKLQEERVAAAQALAGMFSGDASVGEPQIDGDRATVQITVGDFVVNMKLTRAGGLWKVLSVTEQGAVEDN